MMAGEKVKKLEQFTAWAATHIRGDEKGEAQIFLDRLFQGFGHAGWKEAGATCEERVKNDSGGTSFADLVWKPRVVVEMKRRGADLRKYYSQAFQYWTYLVPNRPRYAVLCNFDEFWVYDFETQMDTPVEKVRLSELPKKYGGLSFFFPEEVAPIFGNHHEAVTRDAADQLATCFNRMVKRGVDRGLAQRFVLQILMAFFAEDIGLLEKYLVKRLLDECKSPADTYDMLGGLFEAMNRREGNRGGRYKGVDYFNGGLYADPARVELVAEERSLLKVACDFDWSKVRPEIFGTLFEHSLGKTQRHAEGAHFTNAADIMKIVGPTIVEPWREAIEAAKTLGEMQELANRMQSFKVLDPACGSGNFLFIAYREMKRLEAFLYARMAERFTSVDPNQRPLGFVTATNFYGMDINPFAVEIAKVTMMLAHKLSIDELHVSESALPLDNLDGNIVCRDALVDSDGSRSLWPAADVIVGNPPFLGAKFLKPELGAEYMNRVRRAYPEVPGMADLCVYWIRRTHEQLPDCTSGDPLRGRAGLVGTQNIRSNQSRVGGLDVVVKSGTIVDAVESQPWSGEANVNVSIVNWIKTKDPALLPSGRRLWFKVAPPLAPRARKSGWSHKHYSLDMRRAAFISASLSDKVDVSGAAVLACNIEPQRVFQGQTPGHKGFMLTPGHRAELVKLDPASNHVIHQFLGGDEVLKGTKLPFRFVIDFEQMAVTEAAKYRGAFSRVQGMVLPTREKAAVEGRGSDGKGRSHHEQFLSRWWQLSWGRSELLQAISGLTRYMVCSRVTKRPLFAFVAADVRPGDSLQVFAFSDDYSFGVLQAVPHQHWFLAKSSKLTERLRYTPESVFDTLPWPQAASAGCVRKVAAAAAALRSTQREGLRGATGGLRALYRTFELPGASPLKDAHAALDAAVLEAYGFSARKDILQQLLDLNMAIAQELKAGRPVQGPGIPKGYRDPESLISSDVLGAE